MKAQTTFTELKGSATSLPYGIYTNNNQGYGSVLTVYNPYDSGSYTFTAQQDSQFINTVNLYGHKNIGVLKIAGTHRGINLDTRNTNTFNSGNIQVYGVK